jgi:hypothetical protein
VLQWTVPDVVRWLKQNGYSEETAEGLEKAKVDGKCLLRSSAQVLQAAGVVRLGERKRLVKAIGEIEATCMWSWMGQEVDKWPVGAVAMWLSLHGLQEYVTVFVEQGVTGKMMMLGTITQQWLRDVGVAKFGHVKRILKLTRCDSCPVAPSAQSMADFFFSRTGSWHLIHRAGFKQRSASSAGLWAMCATGCA